MSNRDKDSAWGEHDTKHFYELTPDRILSAVESFGFRTTGRVLSLNSLENRVVDVEIELEDVPKSRSDAFRVVKFYRPGRWSKAQILEEHQFLQDLAERELPVVAPLLRADGTTLSTESHTGIHYALFPRVGGRLSDELNNEQLEIIGRLIARVHQIGSTRSMEARVQLNTQTYGISNLEYLQKNNLLPANFAQPYSQLVEQICAISSDWFRETRTQRIHGDCHVGNILWQDSRAFLFDFDDSLTGPCVQDLWLLLPGRDDETRRKRDTLLDGYEQMYSFDYSSLRLIEALRALRIIHFNTWIARRWEDPSFQRIFAEYGTAKYWSEQIGTLYEQVEYLSGARSPFTE